MVAMHSSEISVNIYLVAFQMALISREFLDRLRQYMKFS
jgi:hypothetical protein